MLFRCSVCVNACPRFLCSSGNESTYLVGLCSSERGEMTGNKKKLSDFFFLSKLHLSRVAVISSCVHFPVSVMIAMFFYG